MGPGANGVQTALAESVFTLALALGGLDAAGLAAHFDERTPRRAVAGFLLLVALMLCALWLGQLVPALVAGEVPNSLVRSGGSLKYVFALDLGLVVPLAALSSASANPISGNEMAATVNIPCSEKSWL